MMSGPDAIQHFDRLARKLIADYDADFILYSGPIHSHPASHFVNMCCDRTSRRKNVCLFIMTDGGSADAAFQIARCLQRNYEGFTVYVGENCKSAGTLVAVGADEIVISDFGELGPLDVQLVKPDELGEVISGLTAMQALNTLSLQSFALFERFFLKIRGNSDLQITTRTSAEIASNITVGLFAPIYAQIDPMRLGEIDRAMRIAQEYGERIKTDNLKPGALESLIADYPSHEFVIDLEEARELFENVREPNQEEAELIRMIHPIMHLIARNGRIIEFLEDMLDDTPEADRADETDSKTDSETGGEHERQIDGTDRADHEEERPEGSDADPEGNT